MQEVEILVPLSVLNTVVETLVHELPMAKAEQPVNLIRQAVTKHQQAQQAIDPE